MLSHAPGFEALVGPPLRELERRVRASREVPTWYSPNHILLASYPKSGNTWVRFILSNLSRIKGDHCVDVDFHSVARYVPEPRRNRTLEGRIETQGLPLFLKTHFPHVRQFDKYKSLVIVRDPADTLVSYYRHLRGAAGKRLPDLSRFVVHWRYGCEAWREWYAAWTENAAHVLRYEDLLADPVGTMRVALHELEVEVDRVQLESAVQGSTRERMRSAQERRGDPHPRNSDYQFVGKARAGWSRELLNEESLQEIYERTGAIAKRYGYGFSSDAGSEPGAE